MKIAYIFPGQGAQAVGMGKDLYENSASARRIFDEADKTLGFSLSRLCFEGPFEELTKTENCQPAIVTASVAALSVFKETHADIAPSFVAGLSLGEYSALVAANIIDFKDAVYLVRKRGELMEEAGRKNPGKMHCILGLDPSIASSICKETQCEVANLNCPGQVVVSGSALALEKLSALATEKGAKRIIPLDVSGAFHSSFMDTAASGLKTEIDKIVFRKPACPLVSNVDAKEQVEPSVIKQNLIKQVNSATYWEASMRYLLSKGVEGFYEIGPGSVLKGLFKKIDSSVKVVNAGKWEELQQAGV